jgi:transposase
MRGRFRDQGGLFSYLSPEARVPAKHPLRQVRELVRAVLKDLSPSFGKLYSSAGRPSIPPEQLLSALLLQVFYGIRSERQLMEQLDYNLLYRWFPSSGETSYSRIFSRGHLSMCKALHNAG